MSLRPGCTDRVHALTGVAVDACNAHGRLLVCVMGREMGPSCVTC